MRKSFIETVFVLILSLCLSAICLAAINTSNYITDANASISGENGITVCFDTTGRHKMDDIGVSSIKIKTASGTTVKTLSSGTYTNLMGHNRTYYSSSITYSSLTSGNYYYAIITFSASDSNGGDTFTFTTECVKAYGG